MKPSEFCGEWMPAEPELAPTVEDKPKDGKNAKSAAMLCGESLFLKWLDVESKDEAVEMLRNICSVQSRAELDNNITAAAAFNDMKSNFEAWKIT